MLQVIRDNMQSFFAWVIIGFLVILMAMFGVDAFFTAPNDKGVAEINGEQVSKGELQQEIYAQKQRLRSMMGENINPAMLDDEVIRGPALENLIKRRLLLQAAEENGVVASTRMLMANITSDETFFVDGKFSQQRYETLLAQSGYNHARYMAANQSDMVMKQLIQGLAGSSFATGLQVEQLASLLNEKRSGEYIRFKLADKLSSIVVTDEEVEAFFSQNKQRFMTKEQVTVNYIHVTPEDFFEPVSDEQILNQYELELQDLDKRDEKRVAHILVEEQSEQPPEKLLAALKRLQAGEEFDAVAKDVSEDVASALMGGDLGVTRGDTFPEDFEKVLLELKPGDVSEPVKTDAGWHLIKLVSVSPFSLPSFEDNRERIEYDLQMASAKGVFPAKVEELADLTFNASDLKEPAEVVGVEVKTSGIFSREDAARLGTPFNEPAVVRAAFSDDVLIEANNSELIHLEDGSAVVLRVATHDKPRLKELATVRQEIENEIKQEKAGKLLAEEVDEKLAQAKPAGFLASNEVFREQEVEVLDQLTRNQFAPDHKLVKALFAASNGQPPQAVTLSNGDIAVFRLTAIIPGEVVESQNLGERIEEMQSSDEFSRFQQALQEQADIIRRES